MAVVVACYSVAPMSSVSPISKALIRRLFAGLALLGLLASFSPHGHIAPSSDLASQDTISSDDFHHEHSSRSTAHETPCVLCRTTEDHEQVALHDGRAGEILAPNVIRIAATTAASIAANRFARQHPGRAPPPRLAS